jgi:hypothetical protein
MSKTKTFPEYDHLFEYARRRPSSHCDVYIAKPSNVFGLPPYPLPLNVAPSRKYGDRKSGDQVILHYINALQSYVTVRDASSPLEQAMQAQGGSRSTALLFLWLGR